MANELTTRDYWLKTWRRNRCRGAKFNPYLPWFRDWLRFQEEYFPKKSNLRLLEVGCAASRWLSLYDRKFGYEVFGIDFDQSGCDLAIQNLKSNEGRAEVYCVDLFEFARNHRNQFDIIVSYGVVEHFSDSSGLLAMKACLKPGGYLFAEVPNHQGLQGLLVSTIIDYRSSHRVYSAETLRELFCTVGLENICVRYAGGFAVPLPKGVAGWRRIYLPLHSLMCIWIAGAYLVGALTNRCFRGRNTAHSIMAIGRVRPSLINN